MSEESGAVRWDVPAIDGGDGNGYMTAGRLEALQQEAYEEAWKKGLADGEAAGSEVVRERCERLDGLLDSLSQPFETLDDEVEHQIVDLAMLVARQLFRREIRTDPSHVIGVVRDALKILPAASRQVEIHLHPDDATLVRETLAVSDRQPSWKIVEDALLSRGGCHVTTENSQIDATAESRLNALITSIAGDERKT
ncbi:MAG: flagellar assembly protein FliH [Woeseiaceae bacterium]|nr:flagellar assembly protein FliH [Woeseiaceae bacterium]